MKTKLMRPAIEGAAGFGLSVARALVVALLIYHLIAVFVPAHTAIALALSGIGLWPAIGLPIALAMWCASVLKSTPKNIHLTTTSP